MYLEPPAGRAGRYTLAVSGSSRNADNREKEWSLSIGANSDMMPAANLVPSFSSNLSGLLYVALYSLKHPFQLLIIGHTFVTSLIVMACLAIGPPLVLHTKVF